MKRRVMHYITTFVILIIYGGQVCPFLESLTLLQLAAPIAAALFLIFVIQVAFLNKIVSKADFKVQSRLVFKFEAGLFIAAGLVVTAFNSIFYGFPVESGFKLVIALSLLGFFTAIDLSLFKEWELSIHIEQSGKWIEPDDQYFSQPRKLILFASVSIIFMAGVIFLVINKDLDWLILVGKNISLEYAQRLILLEVGFVVLILLFHIFNVIYSYSRNLQYFLSKETTVLERATRGKFDLFVPVSSNDEFGVMAKYTNLMIKGLKQRTEELQQTQDITILSLASLAETRDNETGNHILRTQRYVRILAEYLKDKPDFKDGLDIETIDLLYKSSPLHDIGKVGIPDKILLKPGKLTDEEFEIMKTHATLGGETLKIAEKRLGSNSFLGLAQEIARTHHEKWDGTGYPKGLKNGEIPVSGRLMAVADVYDALISKRIYKSAFSHQKAREIISDWRGKNFDPRMVDAFFAIEDQFQQIAEEFQDKA